MDTGSSAPRGDYRAMVRRALQLYEAGVESRGVLRSCYGVDFPEEFFVVSESGDDALELPIDYTNQPWEPAIPPSRGGPAAEPYPIDELER